MAPPVYATDIIMTTNKMRPNPRGARGVNRFFSDAVSGSWKGDRGRTGSKHENSNSQTGGSECFDKETNVSDDFIL
jgi:hypothetical protein